MAGKTLDIKNILVEDQIGCEIANYWIKWNTFRQPWIDQKKELRKYVYATDTTQTSNQQLPWSNKTTIPKLCQIRDNLFANYVATLFPKRRWLDWDGATEADADKDKVKAVKDYMMWVVNQREFKEEVKKLVLDYIDYGNTIGTAEWVDETQNKKGKLKSGYIGPRAKRIDPMDLVMNPTATSFSKSPKIVRSLMSVGEAKKVIDAMASTPEDKEIAQQVFNYCVKLRQNVREDGYSDVQMANDMYKMDGFDSYSSYLEGDYMELLTFMGDLYDANNDKFYENYIIVVVDRHKVVLMKEHPYPLAEIPIYHGGWRVRQDNLWAMGPLDNLVGMQYRLDHVENMKADILDLTTFPPIMVKGLVADFEWAPMERIHVDSDGAVELMSPNQNIMQVNLELQRYEMLMEEMAGSPKEAMGFRTPGEKTAYEVQRLENAASRIFQNKIAQFEEQVLEPLLNSMLVLAKQYLNDTTIKVIDDEFGGESFRPISRADLSANGRLKPVAARHFAEKAERIQNLTSLFTSPIGQDPMVLQHFSGERVARMVEELIDIQDYNLVVPYIRISEMAKAQSLQNAQQEQVMTEIDTPSGLTPEDYTSGQAA